MAVDLTTNNVTVRQSIARVELFTDVSRVPASWLLVYHFEDGSYGDDGVLVGRTSFGSRRVERFFGNIQNTEIDDGSGNMATIAQIAAWIKAAGYVFRQEDIDAASQLQAKREAAKVAPPAQEVKIDSLAQEVKIDPPVQEEKILEKLPEDRPQRRRR
jgi:hypothetical protein